MWRLFIAALFLSAFHAGALPTHSQSAMVTSAQRDATAAGVEILRAGGNAVDAAVATTLALSVTEPFSAGIGGGGFLLVYLHKNKKMLALDFRERAPLLATADMYARGASSTDGYLSVAVPGTIAGLREAHRAYGKLPWAKLFAPAIKLAKDGFEVDSRFVEVFKIRAPELKLHEASWQVFTKDGTPFEEGETLKQADLALTLELLSKDPQDFYRGSIGKALVALMKERGGIITEADLRAYKPAWLQPVCGSFMERKICSMPPPSAGGVLLLEMLNAVEAIGIDKLPWHTPQTIDTLAKVMKFAYKDRAELMGDPKFVEMPISKLISKAYAQEKVKEIQSAPKRESEETTHLNAVDRDGNVVALTFTVNLAFGSGVVVPKTGILLNNEMDDFVTSNAPNAFELVGGDANKIAPGKTPLSSMTPVIALKGDKFSFAVGAPGGSRITSAVFLTILNHLAYKMNVDDAISTGRFHHQWSPDEISVEEHALDPATIKALSNMNNKVTVRRPWVNANMIVASPTGGLDGAADRRGVGNAAGY
jgi:gamma-glutamyltranspeptidase/glutathione hydrolase